MSMSVTSSNICMTCNDRLSVSADDFPQAWELLDAKVKAEGWESLPERQGRRTCVFLCRACLVEIRARGAS